MEFKENIDLLTYVPFFFLKKKRKHSLYGTFNETRSSVY